MRNKSAARFTIHKRLILTFAIALTLPTAALAEDADSRDPSPQEPKTWYDSAHDTLSQTIDQSALWFDEFFGDPRAEVESEADAFLRVTLDGFYSGVEGESEFNVRTSGYVHVPRTENRLRVVFDSDADAAITGENAVETEPSRFSTGETDGGIGLAYRFVESEMHRVETTAGVKSNLDLFANARYQYTRPLGEATRLRSTNTLYWKTDDGFGISSLADFEHQQSEDTVWRYTLFGNYGEETDGLEWSTQATWLRRLDKKSAVSVRVGMNGETEPASIVKETWTTFRYRRNFLRPWLFYEVEPGLSWHEKEDYDTEPTLALRLEVLL